MDKSILSALVAFCNQEHEPLPVGQRNHLWHARNTSKVTWSTFHLLKKKGEISQKHSISSVVGNQHRNHTLPQSELDIGVYNWKG